MSASIADRADFTEVRYAQCWEDADVLLKGLDVRPGDTCLSIASAGDNALALLTADPARVVAVDLNPAQLACLALRVAAYRELDHAGLLELLGSRPSARRAALYRCCRPLLGPVDRAFWDARPGRIEGGIGGAGKFERYFRHFRLRVLPLAHRRRAVAALLEPRPLEERLTFYQDRWDTWRWRLLFRVFFSRPVMGRLGRDPEFFRHVEGSVAERILERTRHALTRLPPAANPYLHWILTGTHGDTLPLALRAEHFETIQARLGRLEWRLASIDAAADQLGPGSVDRFNLSDVFEYLSETESDQLFERLAVTARPNGRLAYWNMLAPRGRPASLAGRLRPLDRLGEDLLMEDKAFFYSRFRIDEVLEQ
jgi:S-adenosylmethionine-diacylglycerol 3-amino-3-carboxypropyl transferase